MEREIWTAGVIEIDVWGFLTTHHRMRTKTEVLGELTLPAFRSGGVFQAVDGWGVVVERTSWWRGWHELRENDIVVGSARPLGFWRRKMSVGFRGLMYELVPAGFWSDAWLLVDGVGNEVVEVRRRGFFCQHAQLTVRQPAPVDLLVFVYYLAHARWQEQAAAASAAAGS